MYWMYFHKRGSTIKGGVKTPKIPLSVAHYISVLCSRVRCTLSTYMGGGIVKGKGTQKGRGKYPPPGAIYGGGEYTTRSPGALQNVLWRRRMFTLARGVRFDFNFMLYRPLPHSPSIKRRGDRRPPSWGHNLMVGADGGYRGRIPSQLCVFKCRVWIEFRISIFRTRFV